jgi:EAL domain-containing protein (putative c-di-GMP-specific phosphodiesterase class I)
VSAIVALAQSLHLKVVAEGVETPEQQAFLTDLGCNTLQGYLLGRPLPPERIEEMDVFARAETDKPAELEC